MKIILPLPPRVLSPNSRGHWAPKAKAVKEYRFRAWAEGLAATNGYRPGWASAEVRAVFCVPDKGRRDPDNLMASLKAAWDGFVDARILTDDKALIIHPPVVMVDRKWPRVEITLTEAA